MDPISQGLKVIYALCVGFISGSLFSIGYLFYRSFDVVFRGRSKACSKFITDLIAYAAYAVVTVIFVYAANNGVIRYFLILFEFAGTILYRLTAGRLFVFLTDKVCALFAGIVKYIKEIVKKLMRPLMCIIYEHYYNNYIVSVINDKHGR